MSPGCHDIKACSGPHSGTWPEHFPMKRIMLKPVATTARLAVISTATTHREIILGVLQLNTSAMSTGLIATKSSRSSFLKLIDPGHPVTVSSIVVRGSFFSGKGGRVFCIFERLRSLCDEEYDVCPRCRLAPSPIALTTNRVIWMDVRCRNAHRISVRCV
jgi:hypothetical protein